MANMYKSWFKKGIQKLPHNEKEQNPVCGAKVVRPKRWIYVVWREISRLLSNSFWKPLELHLRQTRTSDPESKLKIESDQSELRYYNTYGLRNLKNEGSNEKHIPVGNSSINAN